MISSFQNYLDPDSEGLGNGVAPIGAKVTVTTATDKIINIAGKIKVSEGYLFSDVEYNRRRLVNVVFRWQRLRQIESLLYGSRAVILNCRRRFQLSELTLNEGTSDITLEDEEIGARNTGIDGGDYIMPFVSYLPSYYQGVTEIEAIADAFDLEMVDLQENLSFTERCFDCHVLWISSCRWEQILGIIPQDRDTTQRRMMILAMLRGSGKLNEDKIKTIVRTFTERRLYCQF